jgi:hypothetical protein
MAKSTDATRKPRTHFEQVPIDIAKKIAEQNDSKDKKAGTARVGVESTSRKKR